MKEIKFIGYTLPGLTIFVGLVNIFLIGNLLINFLVLISSYYSFEGMNNLW